ncbi:hypothetical protein [Janthinobacterium sp. MDT1-19]|uniref:hypothetical protein n=1 Tax=Janthinobacterium sp. MDT1-19 TaxID=1259339 RepID=UPI003F23743D
MKSKNFPFWPVVVLCSIFPPVQSAEPTVDARPRAEATILYAVIAWGNVVDSGSFLMPMHAYESFDACDTAKKKMIEAVSNDSPNRTKLRCSLAETQNEKLLAQMLARSSQVK